MTFRYGSAMFKPNTQPLCLGSGHIRMGHFHDVEPQKAVEQRGRRKTKDMLEQNKAKPGFALESLDFFDILEILRFRS